MINKVLLALLVFALTACEQGQQENLSSATLTYQTGPTHKDRGAHTYITIIPNSNGGWIYTHGKRYYFISKEDGKYKNQDNVISRKNLTQAQVNKLFSQVIKYDFFNMKNLYNDPQIMDGDYQSLSITGETKDKKVTVINIFHKGFNAIVNTIKKI